MVSKAELNKAIFALFSLCSLPTAAVAQEALITTDGTTATQITTPDSNNFDINGGDKAGGNLFHSFGNFSVPDGGSANFLNSPDIVNIINRVTGGNISEINGLLKANGSANLFLINPAGIIFGQNARLDIGGSFLGSTADSLVFPDGEFSATNTQGKPLLTINAPIGLNLRDNPNSITNNSTPGLEVKSGNNISLVGGDINLEGGRITAPAGRIELGGLSAAGEVKFNENGSLSFPDEVARGNVSLSDVAIVNVTGTQGGNIGITANNIQMTGNSYLVGGTYFATVPLSGFQSGDINLDATRKIDIDRSFIINSVKTSNAGNINITASSLNVNDDARFANIANSTFGVGNAGNITINAKDNVSLNGSTIASNVEAGAVGNSGEIKIDTGTVKLNNGAQIQTLVRQAEKNLPAGEGIAGNIIINSRDAVTLDGKSFDGESFSQIISDLDTGAVGKAGKIEVTTGILTLTNNAGILSRVKEGAVGDGGKIGITAKSLSLDSRAGLVVSTSGTGNAGSINIKANDAVKISNGAIISGNVESGAVGDGGQIDMTAKSLSLDSGAQLQTIVRGIDSENNTPGGKGKAGDINLNIADNVTMTDRRSSIGSAILEGAEGQGGDINIKTRNLSLANRALIDASTSGIGSAGNVIIMADDTIKFSNSNITTDVERGAIGDGGNIDITTKSLSLDIGAQIAASTSGTGNAGNITITADDTVKLSDPFTVIFSTVERGAVGNGSNIDITTKFLSLENSAQLQTLIRGESDFLSGGKGNAGAINLNIADTLTITGKSQQDERAVSSLFSRIERGAEGKGGDINIKTRNLFLADGGTISAGISGIGKAGNITITVDDAVKLSDFPTGILSSVGTGAVGDSGKIEIKAKSLSIEDGAQLVSNVSGKGNAGTINLNIADTVTFTGKSQQGNEVFLSGLGSGIEKGAVGKAGNIEITTGNLSLTNGARLSNSSSGIGDAGNITVNARGNVTIDGFFQDENSNIFASGLRSVVGSGAIGNAGKIELNAANLSLTNGALIDSSTFGIGNAGNIAITAKSLTLDNSVIFAINAPSESISSNEGQINTGGNITINFRDTLKLRGGSKISAQATGDANGGNININASDGFIVAFPDDNDIVATADRGRGGNIAIDVTRVYGFDKNRIQQITEDRNIILSNGENDINSSSGNPQLSGTIQINTDLLDPAKERAKTTENVVEPDEAVASACDSGGDTTGNTFTVSGRGGMPPSPTEPLRSIIIAGESRSRGVEKQRGGEAQEQRSSDDKGVTLVKATRPVSSDEIIPARGMMINAQGQIVLTRYPTPNASQRTAPQSNYCSSSLKQQEPLATNTQSDSSEDTLNSETIEELMNLLYSMNSEK
ncbi:MAG: filamentous hemagglutinin N-terminal domain-containing protein [Xenococcaceae cyanobacterium]